MADLKIVQGRDFSFSFTWTRNGKPMDLTDCSFKMQIRGQNQPDGLPLYATLASSGVCDGPINFSGDPRLGKVAGSVPAAFTKTMAPWKGFTFHDIMITFPGGAVPDFIKGRVSFEPSVTT